jgi:hypothetical protein
MTTISKLNIQPTALRTEDHTPEAAGSDLLKTKGEDQQSLTTSGNSCETEVPFESAKERDNLTKTIDRHAPLPDPEPTQEEVNVDTTAQEASSPNVDTTTAEAIKTPSRPQSNHSTSSKMSRQSYHSRKS